MGGAENHVFYLAQELIKKGHEIEVFTSDLDRKGKIKELEETYQGIKIRRFKTLFRIGDFGSFFPSVFKAIKESESDIASACSIFHKKHEQKTGKPILTMGEFVKVTEEFSKLPISEVEKLIKEGKEEDIRQQKALGAMRKSHMS